MDKWILWDICFLFMLLLYIFIPNYFGWALKISWRRGLRGEISVRRIFLSIILLPILFVSCITLNKVGRNEKSIY